MSDKLSHAIEMEINSDCNLNYAYCPNSEADRSEKGFMLLEFLEKLMQQLAKNDFGGRF